MKKPIEALFIAALGFAASAAEVKNDTPALRAAAEALKDGTASS